VAPQGRGLGAAGRAAPRLPHPGYTTPDGNAWWHSSDVQGRVAKVGSASLRFEHLRDHDAEEVGTYGPREGIDTLVAYDGAKAVGHISWYASEDHFAFGGVDALGVDDAHQRQGIATALYRRAKQIEPALDPRITPWFTDDGEAWMRSLRLASTTRMPDNGVVSEKKTIPMGDDITSPLWEGNGIYEVDISRWSSTGCVALFTRFPGMGVFPIGWLTWDKERHTIEGIYVNPDYRGKGIGVEMAKAAEKASGRSLRNDSGEYTPEGLAWAKKHGIPKAKNTHPVSVSDMARMVGRMNNLLVGSDDLIKRLLLKVG
jgi:GNAT superfamily N-acetyltransferase